MVVLAGDIGGTSTRLAYFDTAGGTLSVLAEAQFPSREAGSLEEIVSRFAAEHGLAAERACFGIAGPVRQGMVRTPNLPWSVAAAELARLRALLGAQSQVVSARSEELTRKVFGEPLTPQQVVERVIHRSCVAA